MNGLPGLNYFKLQYSQLLYPPWEGSSSAKPTKHDLAEGGDDIIIFVGFIIYGSLFSLIVSNLLLLCKGWAGTVVTLLLLLWLLLRLFNIYY